MLDLRSITSIFDSYIITCSLALTIFSTSVNAENFSFASNSIAPQQIPNISFSWVNDYFKSLKGDVDPEDMVDFLIGLRMSLVGMGLEPPSMQELCSNLESSLGQNSNDETLELLDEIREIIAEKESVLCPHLTIAQNRFHYPAKVSLAKQRKKKQRIDNGIWSALRDGAEKNGVPFRQYLDLVINQIQSGKAGTGDFSKVLKCAMRLRDYLDHPDQYEMLVEKYYGRPEDRGAIALCEILAGSLLILVPIPPVQAIGVGMVGHGLYSLAEVGDKMSDDNLKRFPPPAEYVNP